MLSFSKKSAYIALIGVIFGAHSAHADNACPLKHADTLKFVLVDGKWVESVPGSNAVNDTISNLTGLDKGDLQAVEGQLAFAVGEKYLTNKEVELDKVVLKNGQHLAAQWVTDKQGKVVPAAYVAERGSKAEYIQWIVLNKVVENIKEREDIELKGCTRSAAVAVIIHEAVNRLRDSSETINSMLPKKGSLAEKMVLEALRCAVESTFNQKP